MAAQCVTGIRRVDKDVLRKMTNLLLLHITHGTYYKLTFLMTEFVDANKSLALRSRASCKPIKM